MLQYSVEIIGSETTLTFAKTCLKYCQKKIWTFSAVYIRVFELM